MRRVGGFRRNRALDRDTTPDERTLTEAGGGGFGELAGHTIEHHRPQKLRIQSECNLQASYFLL